MPSNRPTSFAKPHDSLAVPPKLPHSTGHVATDRRLEDVFRRKRNATGTPEAPGLDASASARARAGDTRSF